MRAVRNFQDVHAVLQQFIDANASSHHRYTLDRMQTLMKHLGNPQNAYKIIHVAGTSGKTSTCYYLVSMLASVGKKVGLSVSPHVDEVNERVQINLIPLKEIEYCREFSIFIGLVEKSGLQPTYFEILVAFAFWEFQRARVDYAVVEVGLGGLLDGTNVIEREDKICVITDIGLDHIEILGNTLSEIAAQKAGIIHAGNYVFSYNQTKEVTKVLNSTSAQQKAVLHLINPSTENKTTKHLPLFQQRNWFLAYNVYQFVAARDKLSSIAPTDSTNTFIPARMETIVRDGKIIIMDGAHNTQKLEALVTSVRKAYPGKEVAIMVSFVNTKRSRLRNDLEALSPIANHLIFTKFVTAGAPRDSVDPLEMAKICKDLEYQSWEIADNPTEAFQRLLLRPEPVVLITGSFYLLNHIRPLIFKA